MDRVGLSLRGQPKQSDAKHRPERSEGSLAPLGMTLLRQIATLVPLARNDNGCVQNVMHNQKGQTIIEAVVAIAVISLAMLGFLSQATSNFVMGRTSENHFVAYNLASEAIEVSRNVRDSNWLKGCLDPAVPAKCFLWNSGLSNGIDYSVALNFDASIGKWAIDFAPKNLETCGDACLVNTKFSRMIFLQPVCKDKIDCGGDGICEDGEKCATGQIGIKVTAQVGWSEVAGQKIYETTEYLYNWR